MRRWVIGFLALSFPFAVAAGAVATHEWTTEVLSCDPPPITTTKPKGSTVVVVDPPPCSITDTDPVQHTTTGTTTAPPPTPLQKVGISSGYGPITASAAELAQELDGYVAVGAKFWRIDFDWSLLEPNDDAYNWAAADRLMAAADSRGIEVLAMIGYSPAWASGSANNKTPPTDPVKYADFAVAVAQRYPQIRVFELWNEPNLPGFWVGPDPVRYTALVQATYPRLATTGRTVLAGATAPVGGYNDADCNGVGDSGVRSDGAINPTNFIERAYNAGIGGDFDAWSTHPYEFGGFVNHPCSTWKQMSETTPSMRSIMEANGDTAKKLWATEYGNPASVGETVQAQRVTQAIDLWRAFPWSGSLMYFNYHDRGETFGLTRADWSQRPAWDVYRLADKN